jgi:hypothetical protein
VGAGAEPTHDQVKAVLDRHAARLASLPNVVGVGIGDGEEGEVITVYVEKKVSRAQLEASEVVPRTLAATVDGERVEVGTQVSEVGAISH